MTTGGGGDAGDEGVAVTAPLEMQVVTILFALTFTMFVALVALPLLASVVVGVVVKMAELVSAEGYYWLTPNHLILARRQQQESEYARVFS
jgi:hypothetical protein